MFRALLCIEPEYPDPPMAIVLAKIRVQGEAAWFVPPYQRETRRSEVYYVCNAHIFDAECLGGRSLGLDREP